MLAQRRRRWANISLALGQRVVSVTGGRSNIALVMSRHLERWLGIASRLLDLKQLTRVLVQCWARVYNAGSTLVQH